MFLKYSEVKSTNGNINKYYKIVESVRENGTPKHKILFNLGVLSDEKAMLVRQILAGVSNPDIALIDINDVIVNKNMDFLDVFVLHKLWQEWGFHVFFKDFPFAEALTINRCVCPSSKLGATTWNQESILFHLNADNKTKNKYGVYPELDKLCALQGELQKHISSRIINGNFDEMQAVIYDITSTYFEETDCVIALHGYSRDNRPDKEQIVIALAITPKGYPFYWKTYKGNTQDITTIETFIDDIMRDCGVKSGLLVFDRGMVSSDNIQYICDKGFTFITAVDKDEIYSTGISDLDIFCDITKENMKERLQDYSEYDDSLLYHEYVMDSKRYILGFSIEKRMDEQEGRQQKIQRFQEKVNELNAELSKAKKSRNLDKLRSRVETLAKNKKVSKLISASFEELSMKGKKKDIVSYQVHLSVKTDELKKAGQLDGVTCFYTNTPEEITASDVISHYRKKNKVEESFREIKSCIKIRPVFVHKEERVKAHVTICVLAYLLMNTVEQRILDMKDLSAPKAIEALGECKVNFIGLKQQNLTNVTLTKLNALQKNILANLGLENLLSSKDTKALLTRLKECSPTF